MTPQTPQTAVRGARRASPKFSIGVAGWLRQNLFSTWGNSLLTLVCLWLIWVVISTLVRWGLAQAAFGTTPASCRNIEGACWSFVGHYWQFIMVGTYPFAERWRIVAVAAIIVAVAALGAIGPVRRSTGYFWLWVASVLPIFLLIRGSTTLGWPLVDTTQWGGLLLTILLSVVGIGVSFPFSILLALGRRSRMPIIKALCVGYIELIRGVPLITILFMASVMLPLFFPPGFHLDKVLRAQVGIILFAAAYLAEVVRGGLQAIPKGQEEAAQALGLSYWQTLVFIVMPQALRIVIPPLVSSFIALLKDTSLVTIVGLIDLLAAANTAAQNPEWLGKIIEAYVFVGLIYWAICFSMSRYSIHLEGKYKAGQN